MHVSFSEPLDILRWAYRLLYVELFISLIVVMGYWTELITFAFLGAALCLMLPLLFSRKELLTIEEEEEL